MKRLYLLGGTMGVGKSTVGQILKNRLPRCVFLDGDWCWDMHPFRVTEQAKRMVMDNICYLLNSFIRCPDYDNIVFVWVMHEQCIIDEITEKLDLRDYVLTPISLVCDADALTKRLQKDVDMGLREPDVIERSVRRIPRYERLQTVKLDVSAISAEQAAEQILLMEERGAYDV